MSRCFYCGQEERVALFEVWSTREFSLETCCEGMQEEANEALRLEGPAFLRRLELSDCEGSAGAIDAIGLGKLRRVLNEEGGGAMLLDWNPVVVPISQAEAKQFVREHHAHCPPPAGWRFGAGLVNGSELIGVVMVGRPVARQIDQQRVVEVNRLCVRRDLAPGLTWNACSMLYAWAAREAKARGFSQVITYTMQDEPGTTLRAAGWRRDYATRGGSWSRPSRARGDRSPTVPKVRWSRPLSQQVSA